MPLSFLFPPLSARTRVTALLATLTLLAGCAGTSVGSNMRYDLGPLVPPSVVGTRPAVKVLDVDASDALDSDKLVYRLSDIDAQQTGAYAHSHWIMPPAQLLTQHLRMALTANGPVLSGGDRVRAPVLKISLDEFEQVFDGHTQSHGAVTVRATLLHHGVLLGQRTFIAQAPASTPDAAGGARALRAASAELIAQISAWVSAQTQAAPPVTPPP
ncbi:ABC-type transport auxiliary lipoprotein family protein [Paraburkholderia hayleyella]|uniref:ABC-type transport auxiliary lipoprotein family protein n=1 Tax=Paraburkholderia hayleyella TaxID=2152889 RepID=UPI0012922030|nr:ABC-type transport auxiliary lipoprotein family protein [Paraburkholderia hayleyella]